MRFRLPLRQTYSFALDILPDAWALRLAYFRRLKRILRLKDPRAFTEKINWRKLYQRDPRFIIFSDKVAVKSEIVRLVGDKYVIPTLWVGETPEEIPFDRLEPPYVIKVNHGSGDAIFIRERADISRQDICRSLNKKLQRSYGKRDREWAYWAVPRKILVETMLVSVGKAVPEDYKFFVYDGRVVFIEAIYGRFGNMSNVFFDRHWNKLPMTWAFPEVKHSVPKPERLEEMVEIAEKIGTQFDFVRVDLYQIQSGIFFGETTFYPEAGFGEIRPIDWDYKFGEPWKIAPYRG